MIFKIVDDTGCSQQRAFYWVLSAKNSLSNNNGYSPNQLIDGKNFNFPSIDKLPALNEEVSIKTVCDNFQTLHAARKTFITADNSNRLKRALKHNVQKYNDVRYENVMKYYINAKIVISGKALVL